MSDGRHGLRNLLGWRVSEDVGPEVMAINFAIGRALNPVCKERANPFVAHRHHEKVIRRNAGNCGDSDKLRSATVEPAIGGFKVWSEFHAALIYLYGILSASFYLPLRTFTFKVSR